MKNVGIEQTMNNQQPPPLSGNCGWEDSLSSASSNLTTASKQLQNRLHEYKKKQQQQKQQQQSIINDSSTTIVAVVDPIELVERIQKLECKVRTLHQKCIEASRARTEIGSITANKMLHNQNLLNQVCT